MRKFFIALGALALCACQTPNPGGGVATPVGETIVVDATVALSQAADSYAAVAALIEAAVRQGAFTPGQLRSIRTLNDHALRLLKGTDATLTQAQRAASLVATVSQLRSILRSK